MCKTGKRCIEFCNEMSLSMYICSICLNEKTKKVLSWWTTFHLQLHHSNDDNDNSHDDNIDDVCCAHVLDGKSSISIKRKCVTAMATEQSQMIIPDQNKLIVIIFKTIITGIIDIIVIILKIIIILINDPNPFFTIWTLFYMDLSSISYDIPDQKHHKSVKLWSQF